MNCIIKFTFQMGLDWTFLAILPQCVYMVEVHSGSFSHSKSCFPELLVGKHEIGFVCLCQLRWQKLNFKAYKFRPEQNSIRATSGRTIPLGSIILVLCTTNHYIEEEDEEGRKSFLMEVPLCFLFLSFSLSSGYVMNLDNLFPYGHF